MASVEAFPRRLRYGEPNIRLADKSVEQSEGVRAASHTGNCHIRQSSFRLHKLRRGFVADDTLEVTHDLRIRVRTHSRTQAVVRGFDVGAPVAQRLADGVLEGPRAAVDRADFGAQGLHPENVRGLATTV